MSMRLFVCIVTLPFTAALSGARSKVMRSAVDARNAEVEQEQPQGEVKLAETAACGAKLTSVAATNKFHICANAGANDARCILQGMSVPMSGASAILGSECGATKALDIDLASANWPPTIHAAKPAMPAVVAVKAQKVDALVALPKYVGARCVYGCLAWRNKVGGRAGRPARAAVHAVAARAVVPAIPAIPAIPGGPWVKIKTEGYLTIADDGVKMVDGADSEYEQWAFKKDGDMYRIQNKASSSWLEHTNPSGSAVAAVTSNTNAAGKWALFKGPA